MKFSKLFQYDFLLWELDNFTFKVLYWVILYWHCIKIKWNYNTFTVPSKKFKIVSFSSSIMKNIVASCSRFLVKSIC